MFRIISIVCGVLIMISSIITPVFVVQDAHLSLITSISMGFFFGATGGYVGIRVAMGV